MPLWELALIGRGVRRDDAKILSPRLDNDLGVAFRVGEIGKGLPDAVEPDAGGDQRGHIDPPSAIWRRVAANSSGV